MKVRCPICGSSRSAYVRFQHIDRWSADQIDFQNTGRILECCGCERMFYLLERWDSEMAGPTIEDTVEVDFCPPPVWLNSGRRKQPEWIDSIEFRGDSVLEQILRELYVALDNNLRTLAAIGARTAFDQSCKLLGIETKKTFEKKLDEVVKLNLVSDEERGTLHYLVNAGSAAAHRAWRPPPRQLNAMLDVLETFLRRAFLYPEFPPREGIQRLNTTVPARQ